MNTKQLFAKCHASRVTFNKIIKEDVNKQFIVNRVDEVSLRHLKS